MQALWGRDGDDGEVVGLEDPAGLLASSGWLVSPPQIPGALPRVQAQVGPPVRVVAVGVPSGAVKPRTQSRICRSPLLRLCPSQFGRSLNYCVVSSTAMAQDHLRASRSM